MKTLIFFSRKFLIRNLCVSAAFLIGTVLFISTAWADFTFVHRDLQTGIYGNANSMISFRYMRHIWTSNDGAMAAVVQQGGYEGYGLVLFNTLDDGLNWAAEVEISEDTQVASDGIIDLNNDILLVTSLLGDGDDIVNVNFVRLTYDPISHAWSKDLSAQTTVFRSGRKFRATRATIAEDSNGVLWSAFRLKNSVSGIFQIRVYYSEDGGTTWNDSGNSFGIRNYLADKSVKVIAVGSRIAIIYNDVRAKGSIVESFKAWAYREDSQALDDGWNKKYFAKMTTADGDPYGSHWSVAADYSGNIHLSYEDGGIRYIRFNSGTDSWEPSSKMTRQDWHYSSISVAPNNDIYLLVRNSDGTKVMGSMYSYASQSWGEWAAVSSQSYSGYLRMSSPERFIDYMPVLYQIQQNPPYGLMYDLFR